MTRVPAHQAPQALEPFAAVGVLALAFGNYTFMYLTAAAAAVLGAVAILPVTLRRRPSEDANKAELA